MRHLGRALWCFVGVLLLLTFGCVTGGTLEIRQGQEMAVWTVWHDAYGREDPPPKVRWKRGDDLNCTDATSGNPGFSTPIGCREGYTASRYEVFVADRGETTLAWTTLAHELLHCAQLRQGIVDPLHLTAGFKPGGAVDQANALLIERGQ